MILIRKPTDSAIRSFQDREGSKPFSYAEVGGSLDGRALPGYDIDQNRVRLGSGFETFQRAKAAIRRWEMFRLDWVQLCWPDAPIEAGTVVAVLARIGGLWSLNACRIVGLVGDRAAAADSVGVERFGFSYGTLPDHVESGEERFSVEWRRDDDSVWYELFAFSRPNAWYARLGRLSARRAQKRFAAESKEAMVQAVA